MEFDPNDQKVIDLLAKLKDFSGTYPADKFESRRQVFLQHASRIGPVAGSRLGFKKAFRKLKSRGSVPATAASKFIEIFLVLAIVAEAGTASFLYRDKLAVLLRSFSSTPLVIEGNSSPIPDISVTPIGTGTLTGTPEITLTVTPSGTTTPVIPGENGNPQIISTPIPTKGNPGNHYGQTPRPKKNNGTGRESYNTP